MKRRQGWKSPVESGCEEALVIRAPESKHSSTERLQHLTVYNSAWSAGAAVGPKTRGRPYCSARGPAVPWGKRNSTRESERGT